LQKNNSAYSNHLQSIIESSSERAALVYHDQSFGYKELNHSMNQAFEKMHGEGISSGSIVALVGDFDPVTVAYFFKLIQMNAILVPLLRGHTDNYKETCLEISQADFVVSIDSDLEVKIKKLEKHEPKSALLSQLIEKETPGLVLFSSGSTGAPKAAVHDFAKLLAKFIIKPHHQKMINFLMFDHWGGLNTLLHLISGGGTAITTEDRTPENICKLIEKWQVETLPTSPSFLNLLLLSRSYENKNLSCLRLITYGSEPMGQATLDKARQVFPNVHFKQTYGLIELGVFKTKSKSSDSLLIKIDPTECESRIVDGKLELKTSSAMLGYLNAPSPFTADGWFKTNDMVEVHDDYIRILGRDSDLIIIGGEKVYPIEIETTLLEFPEIEDATVYKEPHPLMGNIVCALVKPVRELASKEEEKEFINQVKKFCNERLARHKIPTKIKISYETLSSLRQKKIRPK
jgi:long-chain acyl-CoA synthetase